MTEREQEADDDWQPATSAPGELYTFEGQMKSYGAFVRNFRRNDPGLDEYKRSMTGVAKVFLGLAAAVIVLSIVLSLF